MAILLARSRLLSAAMVYVWHAFIHPAMPLPAELMCVFVGVCVHAGEFYFSSRIPKAGLCVAFLLV